MSTKLRFTLPLVFIFASISFTMAQTKSDQMEAVKTEEVKKTEPAPVQYRAITRTKRKKSLPREKSRQEKEQPIKKNNSGSQEKKSATKNEKDDL